MVDDNKDLYEKLLIHYMFKDEEVRTKLLPYLKAEVFDSVKNVQTIKTILSFISQHETFPKLVELKLFIKEGDLYTHIFNILNMDVTDYSKEFILEELEEFYRKSLIVNALVEMQENINKPTNELQNFPDTFRESLAFTFDSNIGLSFLDDAERMYAALHDKDKVISTGLKSLDKYIAGGLHEKSMSLFLAACVTKDTKVRIRVRKRLK